MDRQRIFKVGYWLGHVSLQYGGIGPYALRVISSLLAEFNPGWHMALLCDADAHEAVSGIISGSKQSATVHRIPSVPVESAAHHGRFGKPVEIINHQSQPEPCDPAPQQHLKAWLEDLRLDLLHFTTPTPPHPQEHVPYAVPPLLETSAPYIVTVHDLQELHFPEYFSPAQRAIRAMHRWKTLDQSRQVIVSYDHVKDDLLKFFRLPPEKIQVCPIPFREIGWPEPTPQASRLYSERYAPRNPFLLYPAQTWPHKNHRRLIQSLEVARQRSGINLKLICTGHTNDFRKELDAQIEALNLGDAIYFTGIVPEDELAWLYRHASLVVIPTEYEAGSFPLMEAIMMGVPVICSDVTSLPETIGDQRFIFSPHDVQAMSDLIQRMLLDVRLREVNIANSKKQATRLRTVNAAAHFYAAYRSSLGLS